MLTLIRCPFHPRDTAVARKRPWPFGQKCRWQATRTSIHPNIQKNSLGEVQRGGPAGRKRSDRKRNRTRQKHKRGDSKVDSNDGPEIPDGGGGRHQTPPASPFGGTCKRQPQVSTSKHLPQVSTSKRQPQVNTRKRQPCVRVAHRKLRNVERSTTETSAATDPGKRATLRDASL